MVHSHTVHLPRGALLSPCAMCGTGHKRCNYDSHIYEPDGASGQQHKHRTNWPPEIATGMPAYGCQHPDNCEPTTLVDPFVYHVQKEIGCRWEAGPHMVHSHTPCTFH